MPRRYPQGKEDEASPLIEYEVDYITERRVPVFNQARAAAEMNLITPITPTRYSRIRRNIEGATPEHCLAFARFFNRPVEKVLRDFGHPYPDYFIVLLERRPDVEDREYILKMLKLSRHNTWMEQTDWRTSPYKDDAERILTRSDDPIVKARMFADMVHAWAVDPERNTPRAARNTDEAIARVMAAS